jgi:hypothetical protein
MQRCGRYLGSRLHIEELYNLYPSPNFIRVTKSRVIIKEEHVARMDKIRYAYRELVGKDEEKRPLVRTWRRRENNINLLAPEFFI